MRSEIGMTLAPWVQNVFDKVEVKKAILTCNIDDMFITLPFLLTFPFHSVEFLFLFRMGFEGCLSAGRIWSPSHKFGPIPGLEECFETFHQYDL